MTRLKTSSQRQRMDPGALSAAVERFAAHLAGLGYTPLTVVGYFDSSRHFGGWLRRWGAVLHRSMMKSLLGSQSIGAGVQASVSLVIFQLST